MFLTWKGILVTLQALVAVLFIGTLLTINFTDYTGYSYEHCKMFNWKTSLQTAKAHQLLRTSSPDDTRVADLDEVQHALDLYFDNHASYPIVRDQNYARGWQTLTSLLIQEALLAHTLNDPCNTQNQTYQYVYLSSESGDTYVLGALLSNTDYRYVATQHNDSDSMVLDLWCGKGKFDREFCLKPTPHEH